MGLIFYIPKLHWSEDSQGDAPNQTNAHTANSPTFMLLVIFFFQISSLERNVEETLCSLKFAQRVCKVELGPAARKIESGGHCENYS